MIKNLLFSSILSLVALPALAAVVCYAMRRSSRPSHLARRPEDGAIGLELLFAALLAQILLIMSAATKMLANLRAQQSGQLREWEKMAVARENLQHTLYITNCLPLLFIIFLGCVGIPLLLRDTGWYRGRLKPRAAKWPIVVGVLAIMAVGFLGSI